MKILHVTNAVGWSGGCQQLTTLLEGLKNHGHENILVCPPESELLNRVPKSSAQFEICPMFQDYDLFAAIHLRNFFKKHSPDILHAHHSQAHAIALISIHLNGKIPFIVSRRVSFNLRKNIFSRWKYRSKKITNYVAVSSAIKQTLIEGGVQSEKIKVIYSAYDAKSFFPREADKKIVEELKIPDNYKVVGKVANYSEWKGQKIFLEAAKRVLQENYKVIFVLAGKDTENLQEAIQRLGIGASVRLLGFRKDIPQIISVFNVSVNSAIEGEGLSGALRESLAMKIPVIASDVSGNREIVQDGITGLLVPKNNPAVLAQKILYALENNSEMKRTAQTGFIWVQENCSLETMVSKHVQLYESSLSA